MWQNLMEQASLNELTNEALSPSKWLGCKCKYVAYFIRYNLAFKKFIQMHIQKILKF
jgi:hypothetical protein